MSWTEDKINNLTKNNGVPMNKNTTVNETKNNHFYDLLREFLSAVLSLKYIV